jgi:hypothetical protein
VFYSSSRSSSFTTVFSSSSRSSSFTTVFYSSSRSSSFTIVFYSSSRSSSFTTVFYSSSRSCSFTRVFSSSSRSSSFTTVFYSSSSSKSLLFSIKPCLAETVWTTAALLKQQGFHFCHYNLLELLFFLFFPVSSHKCLICKFITNNTNNVPKPKTTYLSAEGAGCRVDIVPRNMIVHAQLQHNFFF